MDTVIYYTQLNEEMKKKRLEHMIGEKLLEKAIWEEHKLRLAFEPRATGEHGKPFFTLRPQIHYNITHSGDYVACALADQEIGIDIQEHRSANYERILGRMVEKEEISRIMQSEDPVTEFYTQWVLREAYIKWTGEGLSRDLRTISMDEGFHQMLSLKDGYSGAVWMAMPRRIQMKYAEVSLP